MTARLNYLSHDRPDIKHCVADLCCSMASPTGADLEKLKRVVRYLRGHPQVQWLYAWQAEPEAVNAWSDSDWAGHKGTRRSTSASCLMVGTHLIKIMSRRQRVIALSSAEAELYATV